jgi:hypothetical protein
LAEKISRCSGYFSKRELFMGPKKNPLFIEISFNGVLEKDKVDF